MACGPKGGAQRRVAEVVFVVFKGWGRERERERVRRRSAQEAWHEMREPTKWRVAN